MTDRGAYADWVPSDYLAEYYRDLQEDERSTSRYFVEQIRAAPPGPMLCFGCGPTLHHVFLAAPWTTEIYLADYVPENLAEIERWRQGQVGAHDWSPFVRYTLLCESGREPSDAEIGARMDLLRTRIAGLVHADATLADPLGAQFRGRFSAVLSPYCAEATTSNKAEWAQYCRNIASLVGDKGLFLTSAVRLCSRYKSGSRYFPATPIDEKDLREVLLRDFREDSVQVEVREVLDHASQGFSGILLARALKA
jgi:NNMT/PNMT/TEMT family protein